MSPLSSLLLPALLLLGQTSATPILDLSALSQKPTLPPSSLPAPDANTTLQYVVLGVGTQNYTCADATSTPTAVGAIAKLYDATHAVDLPYIGQLVADQLTCQSDKYNSGLGLPRIGFHYFTAKGVPTFDLSYGTRSQLYPNGRQLSGKRLAATPAPADACRGRNGSAAVPWLALDDAADGTSRGLKRVYRVNTTGGAAPATCAGQAKAFEIDYAAEYWFYN